ncbi:MAG: hypothetical protein J6V97_02610, partial [Prevotella sp.]|nr:hypothetical protein [Prevotella sp.]
SNLCQSSEITIDEPTDQVVVNMPGRSLNTYIFMIDDGSAAIEEQTMTVDGPKTYYDLQGRRQENPKGLCVERSADGSSRIINMGR